jgi:hypothetical protein
MRSASGTPSSDVAEWPRSLPALLLTRRMTPDTFVTIVGSGTASNNRLILPVANPERAGAVGDVVTHPFSARNAGSFTHATRYFGAGTLPA